jgi:hypothetical protein
VEPSLETSQKNKRELFFYTPLMKTKNPAFEQKVLCIRDLGSSLMPPPASHMESKYLHNLGALGSREAKILQKIPIFSQCF